MNSKFRVVDLCYMAICAALIAICSWISIPAAVPFTLQTFAVFSVLGLLGGRRGTVSILVYILLGAIGLPVFTGFNGGVGVLLGTTGGYVLGFVFAGLIYWMMESHFVGRRPVRFLAMVIGLFICYGFGTAWFMFVYARRAGEIALGTALTWCVIPFVIPDLVKMGLAVIFSDRLKKDIH